MVASCCVVGFDKMCKQFVILHKGLEIKKLGGMFSSLTLFMLTLVSTMCVFQYRKSALFGHGGSIKRLLSAQFNFSLKSLAIMINQSRSG